MEYNLPSSMGDPGCWSRSLASLCEINHADVRRIAIELSKTNKKSIAKGYKFFWDSYVHNIEGKFVL